MEQRSSSHRQPPAAVLMSLVILLTAGAAPSVAIVVKAPAISGAVGSGVECQTSACVALSAGVSSKMNVSADPCVDFFNYACGNFPINYKYDPDDVFKSVKRTEPMLLQSSFSVMRNQLRSNLFEVLVLDWLVNSTDAEVRDLYSLVRKMFRGCTSWTRYRSLKNETTAGNRFFSSILTHLLEDVSQQRSNQTVESILARIVNTDVNTMFDVRVPIAYLKLIKRGDKAKLKKASRVVISADTKMYKAKSDFEPYLEFFSTIDKSSVLTLDNQSDAFNRILSKIQSLERSADWAKDCNVSAKRSQYKIKDLDALSRCANQLDPFSWTLFFKELLQADYDPSALVELKTTVRVINFVSYFKKRPMYDENGRLASHHSLLIVDWLLSFAGFLPKRLERLWEDAPLRGKAMEKAAGGAVDVCLKWTKDLLSPVLERMYQKAYQEENYSHVQDIVALLQNITAESILKQDWINEDTKDIMLKKLMSIKQTIGFRVLSADELKGFYAPAIRSFRAGRYSDTSMDKNFGRLFSIALSASARKKFNVLCENGSVAAFVTLSPLTANAYNYMRQNEIVFPMGVLTPPMYHRDYPDYMNLGGIGLVIGHEIGHAFDIKGHRINEEGSRGDFWDNATVVEYLRRTDCVMSRYGSYELVPGMPHWSNTTLGNDIADNMGLKSAFVALQTLGGRGRRARLPHLPAELTPEKLFFVQAAQSWCLKAERDALVRKFRGIKHSPPHLRVKGMMQNSAEFARVFKCTPGQAMNPPDKCEFW